MAACSRPDRSARRRAGGYTLVELMISLAVIGVLAGLSISSYLGYVEKARVASAIAQIAAISRNIDAALADEAATLPTSLAELDYDHLLDPWGRPYQYLLLAGNLPPGMSDASETLPPVAAPPAGGGGGPAIGQARKDGFLVPINSDYDLYSLGRDGLTQATLRAQESLDDVIRAADGSYIGLAEYY